MKLLLLAALLLGQADAGAGAGAGAGEKPMQRVRITVRAIAATNGAAPGMDPRLSPIAPHLASFNEQFRFKSYQLLEEQTFDLDWKSAAQMELPGSRSLQVTPRQLDRDGRIKVHLELLGEHPLHSRKLHTDYAIQRGGTILVGGIRVDPADDSAGKLLIAVTQEMEK